MNFLQLLISLFVLMSASALHGQTVKYYRFVSYNGQHQYEFRMSVSGKDTALSNLYRVTYDQEGRLTRWDYLKALRPELDPAFNVASVAVTYEGEFQRHSYLDPQGRPKSGTGGEYSEKFKTKPNSTSVVNFQYDRRGRLIENDGNGCSRYLWTLDTSGRHIQQYCLDSKGNKVSDSRGIYETKFKYDSKGRFLQTASYHKDGRPGKGVSRIDISYDNASNPIEYRYSDSLGLIREGYATIRYEYDKNGYLTRSQQETSEGLLIAAYSYLWDQYGNLAESREYGADGELISEYAISRNSYNSRNQIVESITSDWSGIIQSYLRYTYDVNGLLAESVTLNGGERPMINGLGYAKITYSYDSKGQVEYESLTDTLGLPINGDEGYAYKFWKWRDDGQVSEVAYYNVKKELVIPATEARAAAITWEYDAYGDFVGAYYYDAKGDRFDPDLAKPVSND